MNRYSEVDLCVSKLICNCSNSCSKGEGQGQGVDHKGWVSQQGANR